MSANPRGLDMAAFEPFRGSGVVKSTMKNRNTNSKTKIDFLPPFGESEVSSTGIAALDTVFSGLAAAGVAYADKNCLQRQTRSSNPSSRCAR